MIDITHKDNHAFLIPRDGSVAEAEIINKLINMLKPNTISFYFSMNGFTVCNPYAYFDNNSFYLLRQIVVLERAKKEIYHIVNDENGRIGVVDMENMADTPDGLMDPPTEFNEDERGI